LFVVRYLNPISLFTYPIISILSPIKRLESIAKLANQRAQGTGVSTSYRNAVKTFLADIEENIKYVHDLEGDRDLLDDEWIRAFETSVAPLDFFVSEIRPIIRNSIHGISPKELAEYAAGRALEPTFNNNQRIEG
jgi:hypothetical protein